MGIEGLLKFFRSKVKRVKLSELKGKRIGIDGYVWLHRAIFSGNFELATNSNGLAFVNYFLKNAKFLLDLEIIPIVVFDGDKLGNKNVEDSLRDFRREEKEKLANEYYQKGDIIKAKKIYISSLDITPEMAKKVADELKKLNIEYIVAPYEADAQLAYLDRINYVDYIMTEDSDLIAYGCRKILYKFNRTNKCDLISSKDIISEFKDYSQFLEFCILSGCDFFKCPKISICSSFKLIKQHESFLLMPMGNMANSKRSKKNVCQPLEKKINFKVLLEKFYMAKFTFLHQLVYCPLKRMMVSLKETPLMTSFNKAEQQFYDKFNSNEELKSYLIGHFKNGAVSLLIKNCAIHPMTLKHFSEEDRDC